MATLLQINSSIFGGQGVSTTLADRFVSHWQAANPDGQIIRRDVAAEPLPHLDSATVAALMTPAGQRTPAQAERVTLADTLIDEIQRADVLVIGAPMYNFTIPSQLKSWFDYIARARVTFRYTEHGPEGLLTGKKAYVFATRGSVYGEAPADGVTTYVRQMLAFLGIVDVEFIYADGLNMGDEPRTAAIAGAEQAIAALTAA
ncbi:MAG: FMN-dependent NADH-azoreductase [Spongiibacteraceae bacterium]|jgi:FMN-dependent NADH-azoreductase|nr:FMN-dependent NADH-azoreductase [Spongiibacteraceae bacterium]